MIEQDRTAVTRCSTRKYLDAMLAALRIEPMPSTQPMQPREPERCVYREEAFNGVRVRGVGVLSVVFTDPHIEISWKH